MRTLRAASAVCACIQLWSTTTMVVATTTACVPLACALCQLLTALRNDVYFAYVCMQGLLWCKAAAKPVTAFKHASGQKPLLQVSQAAP